MIFDMSIPYLFIMFVAAVVVIVAAMCVIFVLASIAQFVLDYVNYKKSQIRSVPVHSRPVTKPAVVSSTVVKRKQEPKRAQVPKTPPLVVRNPPKTSLNTTSNIKEYRLPDGSKIAFDANKVEFSEKPVII